MIHEILGIPISIIKPGTDLSVKLTGKSVLDIICPVCHNEIKLQIASIKRTITRIGSYRCISCGMKEKHTDPSYKEKHKQSVLDSWTDEKKIKQSIISKDLWSDPKFKQKITDSSKESWLDENLLKSASMKSKDLWKDQSYVDKQIAAIPVKSALSRISTNNLWSNPEYIKKQSDVKSSVGYVEIQRELAIERWKDDSYRNMVIDSLNEFYSDEDVIKEISNRTKILWEDPAYIDKQIIANANVELSKKKSENAKKQWQIPSIRQKIIDGVKKVWEDPEYRKAASEISKAQWQNENFRLKQAEGRANILVNGKDSILERIAQNVLGALEIEYTRHHLIGYFEFDLFIPSGNLLIECNGEYWHSLRKSKDAAKFTYVDKYFPEYKILYLWERDFLNPGLIHKKIVQALSLEDEVIDQTDFSFKDLEILKLNVDDVIPGSYYSAPEEFLQSFHYSGYGRSASAIFGAFFNKKLISVCKFCPPIRDEVATSMGFSQKQIYELDRFCIHPAFQKKNLASWFIARCSKLMFNEYPSITALVSFSDSTMGHVGTIYRASNWEELHKVRPDYHYINKDGYVIHKRTLYSHASKNCHSESEYANMNDYTKVFGKEKTKFCLRRK